MARSFPSRLNLDLGNRLKRLVSEQLHDEALRLYKQKIHPLGTDGFTAILPSVIKACSFQQEPFLINEQLHCLCLKSGAGLDTVVSNSLVSMYVKFSNTFSARKLFDEMLERDTVSYCSIVNCYIQDGLLYEAVKLLKEMYFDGFVPKSELVASLLSLCTRVGRSSKVARMLHALSLVDERMQGSVLLSTALVDMYLKFDDPATAFYVFERMEVKNEVSWTAMISGCVANGNYKMGVGLFLAMQRENLRPNRVTLMSILPACVELGSGLRLVKEIHGFSFRNGFDSDDRLTSALVTMYCRCGDVRLARLLFEESKVRDVVMWSSMIGGYAEAGDCSEAMNLLSQMREEGTEPNLVTLLAVVSACKHSASLSFASRIHSYILKCGFMSSILLGNALIDMYAKCGSLLAAREVFYQLSEKDLVSWSSMINAYGLHGHGSEALEIFQEMLKSGEKLDAMAFLAVLSACNHAGLVEEAQKIFREAEKINRMTLTLEHYACYINLLGRSGKIDDAVEAVKNMPMKPSARIWSSLLSACEIHDRRDVSHEIIASELMKSEPDNPANYVLLSKIHAESGNCYGAEEVRRVMLRRGLNKCYGFSKVES
ncbi:pentatricopeptide repeat-containing protein At4g31070, mitochondrial-like [Brassica napus]|uniref:pentatricopeptide repeat-containing protein At4g31070, mitochondrial-like n=1 Tax=Brassica napus TaxID=3708 RepID=UPI0006AB59AE|nr:pentatricopeptide repeat-containing protein At4g31070, mitochondrial-like [Brassica napus]